MNRMTKKACLGLLQYHGPLMRRKENLAGPPGPSVDPEPPEKDVPVIVRNHKISHMLISHVVPQPTKHMHNTQSARTHT